MIDCPPETMAASTRFWSAALGAIPIHSGDATDPYVALDGALGELRLELQQVDDQPRIHLDIETDDVEPRCGVWNRQVRSATPRSRVGGYCATQAVIYSVWYRPKAPISNRLPVCGIDAPKNTTLSSAYKLVAIQEQGEMMLVCYTM
jgi:hypothetical protein